MQTLGLKDEDIKQFADATYWLDYFPPLAVKDLKSIGLHVSQNVSFNNKHVIRGKRKQYCKIYSRWIGAEHLLQLMQIHFSIHLYVGNFNI